MEEFELIGPDDHPALLAISSPDILAIVKASLSEMGYKAHVVDSHPQFETRYNQVNYELVFIEETFAGGSILDNASLQIIQNLPMSQRRYATFFLVGPTCESLNTMQAFAQSVHCVLNPSELQMVKEVVQKTIAENDLFLRTFRDVQRRVFQKGS